MGTIKIGSSANRKGITINPSTVLFNGNNVIAIKRGLTTIWDNLKALVPTMTSNTAPSGEAKADSKRSGNAYYVFDNNSTTHWVSSTTPTTTNNCYVQYKFTTATKVNKVAINDRWNESLERGGCAEFIVQGSNDGSAFDDIYSGVHPLSTDLTTLDTHSFENDNYYLYYRLKINSTNSQDYGSIRTLQFYGIQ